MNFFKNNIKKVFIRKKNNFEKYKSYKQRNNQSIRNYDAHRIALIAKLHSSIKSSSTIKLQNFVMNFTQNNQNFLAKQNIENNKNVMLKRLMYRENNKRKKQRNINKSNDNKRKKIDENFDDERNNKQKVNRKKKRKFETIINSKAKINLISNALAKQFKLISIDVLNNCNASAIESKRSLKNYEIYFVTFEIQNENEINRFFNDNFIKTNCS